MKFETIKENLCNKQICVFKGHTDKDIEDAVRLLEPAGTENNWSINQKLGRVQCDIESDKEHICLVC